MNNKDIIIKIARRLERFTLDEMVVVSELEEEQVNNILSDLLAEKIITQSNNAYYFKNKKDIKKTSKNSRRNRRF